MRLFTIRAFAAGRAVGSRLDSLTRHHRFVPLARGRGGRPGPRRRGVARSSPGADVLAIEGEKSTTLLAAMVRTVWLCHNRPDASWSGGSAAVTNHQIMQTLEAHPRIREFVPVGDRIATETGMIKSAAGCRLPALCIPSSASPETSRFAPM